MSSKVKSLKLVIWKCMLLVKGQTRLFGTTVGNQAIVDSKRFQMYSASMQAGQENIVISLHLMGFWLSFLIILGPILSFISYKLYALVCIYFNKG